MQQPKDDKEDLKTVDLPPDTPLVQVKQERSSQSDNELRINPVKPKTYPASAVKMPLPFSYKPIQYELDAIGKNVPYEQNIKLFASKSALL